MIDKFDLIDNSIVYVYISTYGVDSMKLIRNIIFNI